MKTLLFLFALISCAAFAQVDSVAIDSTVTDSIPPLPLPSSGLFGLSWLVIAGILTGVETILRVLPIPAKYSLINWIGYLIKAIPNNVPKQ